MTADDFNSAYGFRAAFALVFARVGAAMALLPGLGEIGGAGIRPHWPGRWVSPSFLLPGLQPLIPVVPDAGLSMGLMVAGEVVTGLWFGWIARMIALALPIGAQFIGYLIGLVQRPSARSGTRLRNPARWESFFEMAAPVLSCFRALQTCLLMALDGLFHLIPPGQLMPAADTMQVALSAVGTTFSLALQLASPFVVMAIVWHLAVGQIARVSVTHANLFCLDARANYHGPCMLMMLSEQIIIAWQDGVQAFFSTPFQAADNPWRATINRRTTGPSSNPTTSGASAWGRSSSRIAGGHDFCQPSAAVLVLSYQIATG